MMELQTLEPLIYVGILTSNQIYSPFTICITNVKGDLSLLPICHRSLISHIYLSPAVPTILCFP